MFQLHQSVEAIEARSGQIQTLKALDISRLWILELNLVQICEAVSSWGGDSHLSKHQCLRQSIRKRLQCTGVWFHPESWWVWVVRSFLQIFGSSWLWQGSVVPYSKRYESSQYLTSQGQRSRSRIETDKIKLDKAVQPFLSLPSCTKCTSIGFDVTITINYIPIIFAGWIPYGPQRLGSRCHHTSAMLTSRPSSVYGDRHPRYRNMCSDCSAFGRA